MTDALSIEQNNKVRVALGLKPLPVPGAPANDGPTFREPKDRDDASSSSEDDEPGSTLESREAQGYENWNNLQEEAEAKRKRQARNDAIRKARDAAQRMAKLEGKGLGETDGDALDTKSWLMQHKKMQKKIEKSRAKKLAEELAEREQMAAAEYTSEDLAGVKVGHELGDFDQGGEQVLTLKDTTIDENEESGDELENVALREMERTNERVESKKKKTGYNPLDNDSSGSILAQYDEEIDGKKGKHFTLDDKQMTPAEREAKRQDVSSKLKGQEVRLDDIALSEPAPSDYQEPTEIKMKKPKKKKTKTARKKAVDDDDIFPTVESTGTAATGQSNGDGMDVDGADRSRSTSAPAKKRAYEDEAFVDDEDLQASLAAQRRAALKKRKKTRPEDLARQMREESEQASNGMDVDKNGAEGEGEEGPGLVIDETSEFVANLQRPTIPERPQRSVSRPVEEDTKAPQPVQVEDAPEPEPEPEPEDVDMDRSYNDIEDDEELNKFIERAESTPEITATGLDEEGTLNQGIGGTLAMLKQRGLVEESEASDLNSLHRDRQKFLLQKQRREADAEKRARMQRERDRSSGKLDRMSARDREEYARWENKQRDQQESRQMADVFNREYKPDVQLKYVDDFGRQMNRKEAFKTLSHQFHGKGSGKMKTEKHLKKVEDEKKRESMSTLDSSQHTGMNNAMGATARRNRQAGVRLA